MSMQFRASQLTVSDVVSFSRTESGNDAHVPKCRSIHHRMSVFIQHGDVSLSVLIDSTFLWKCCPCCNPSLISIR